MATFDFRILLETVEGKKFSYYSSSFVDTSTDLVLSASQVYNRITGSVSASYQNTTLFTGSNVNTSYVFKDNSYLSTSLDGDKNTGTITFTTLDKEYDRLLRYKFMGSQKVCNVLGLPSEQWVYVDQLRLPVDDESNYFEGNIKAANIHVDDTITFANTSTLNSDLPILIDTGSDRYIKFVDTRGVPENALIMGYDVDTDKYEISASVNKTFHISNVDRIDSTLIDSTTISSSTIVLDSRIRMMGAPARLEDTDGDTAIKFNDPIANLSGIGNNNFGDDGIGFYSNDSTFPKMVLSPNALSINTSNIPMDFRVDGDTNDNLFLVSGSVEKIGILTDNPQYTLDVNGDIRATGTGSFGRLETTVVSSSVIYSSGSNIFGDTIADTHLFNGHITASGNISSSITSTGSFGHIMKGGVNFDTAVSSSAASAGFGSGGGGGGSGTVTSIVAGDGLNGGTITSTGTISVDSASMGGFYSASMNDFTTTGFIKGNHITASGDISSSGYIHSTRFVGLGGGGAGNQIQMGTDNRIDLNPSNTVAIRLSDSLVTLNQDTGVNGYLNVTGNITASGDISSSGYVYADRVYLQNNDVLRYSSTYSGLYVAGGIETVENSSFGNHITDTHTFNGHITASGNISASGVISSSRLYVNVDGSSGYQDYILQVQEDRANKFTVDGGGNISPAGTLYIPQYITHTGDTDTGLEFATNQIYFKAGNSGFYLNNGHITASGNISASGNVHGHIFKSFGANVAVLNSDQVRIGNTTNETKIFADNEIILGNNTEVTGHITASGNISSSGTIHAGDEARIKGNAGVKFELENTAGTSGYRTLQQQFISNKLSFNRINDGGAVAATPFIFDMYTGRFGIGDTTPNALLDVDGSTIFGNSSDDTHQFTGNITVAGNISSSGAINTLSHITASGNISASGTSHTFGGNVGIGTTTPEKPLHVSGSILVGNSDYEGIFFSGSTAGGSSITIGNDRDLRLNPAGSLALRLYRSSNNAEFSGDVIPAGNNSSDLGRTAAMFKDLKLAGDITASGNISSSGTITGNSIVGTLTGTATGLAGTPDIVVGSLTATSITSSIVTSSIIYTEGSNIFGDAIADTHLFNGHITASGNISASGDITADNLESTTLRSTTTSFNIYPNSGNDNGRIQAGQSDTTFYQTIRPSADNSKKLGSPSYKWSELNVNQITASGNISASGDGLFDSVKLNNGDSSNMALDFQGSNPTGLFYDGTNFTWRREGSTALSFAVGNLTFGGGGNSKISAVTNTSLTLRGGTTNTVFNTTGITTEGSISSSGAINTLSHITASGNISSSGVGTFGSLDISGNIDVDGTTNLDVVDIDGDVSLAGDLDFETSAGRDITFGDNLGAALEFKEAGNLYMRFVTTNGSEGVTLNKGLTATSATFSNNITANGNIVGDGSTDIYGINNISASGDFIQQGDGTEPFLSASSGNLTLSGSGTALLEVLGNISGSSTSTGSFGHLMVGGGNFTSASLAAGGGGGGSGTVTSIVAGDGLNGGTITSTGTISVDSASMGGFYSASMNDFTTTGFIKGNHITASGNISASGNLTIGEWIYHGGETAGHTGIWMTDQRIRIKAGDISYLDMDDSTSAPHNMEVNAGGNNLDFKIRGQSDNPLFKTDASTDRIGTNGRGTPLADFHIGGNLWTDSHITASGNISASGTITGNSIVGTLTGTATGLAGTPDIIVGSLTATSITSSIVTSSILHTEGSNIFGDTIDDTHLFNGHISASGNISSSGNLLGSNLLGSFVGINTDTAVQSSKLQIGSGHIGMSDAYDIFWGAARNTKIAGSQGGSYMKFTVAGTERLSLGTTNTFEGNISANGAINTLSHITASGNISASGTLIGNAITLPNDSISGDLVSGGTIGTTTITALAGHLSLGDNDITNVGNISVDVINDEPTEGDTNIAMTGTTLNIEVGQETHLESTATTAKFSVPIETTSHITASGNISASGGNLLLGGGTIDLKNTGTQSNIKLYCESSNAHYVKLQAPEHSEFSGNVTVTLPPTTDTLVGKTTTDTLTNKTLTSPDINTPDIDGGNIDNTVIGASTPAVGTFSILTGTNITASNNISASGNLIGNQLVIGGGTFTSASLAAGGGGGGSADNLGNHTATQDLDLDGNDIFDVNHITASGNISGSITSTGSFANVHAGTITITHGADGTDRSGYPGNFYMTSNNIIKTDDSLHIVQALNVNNSKFIVNNAPTGNDVTVTGDMKVTSDITASANISASGNLIGNELVIGGGTFTSASLAAGGGGGGGDVSLGDNVNFGNITASGDISASGKLYVTDDVDFDGTFKLGEFTDVSASLAAAVAGGDNLGNHTATAKLKMAGFSIENANHITSSGNISASGDLYSNKVIVGGASGSVDGITVLGDISASGGFFVSSSGNVMINSDNVGSMATHLGALSVNYGNDTQLTGSIGIVGDGYGDIVKIGGTTTIKGNMYYLDTDSTWTLTNATDDSAGADKLLAIALGTNSDIDGMLLKGFVHLNPAGTIVVGAAVYMRAGTGATTFDKDTGTGNINRIVGYGLSLDGHVYFNPDSTWVEHS